MVFDVAAGQQGAGVVAKTNLREIFVDIVVHVAQTYTFTIKQGAVIVGKQIHGHIFAVIVVHVANKYTISRKQGAGIV